MKVKLFTHTDLDGVGCAILGKLAFKNIDVEYCNYDDINNKVGEFLNDDVYKYDLVYITDISVSEDVAYRIETIIHNNLKLKPRFKLIDHHSTALWLNRYDWAEVVEKTILICCQDEPEIIEKVSGTYLLFIELISEGYIKPSKAEYESLKVFADTVRKYDTWLWKEKYNDLIPKKWNDLFYILGRDRFINKVVSSLKEWKFEFSSKDELLLELEQEKIDRYIENKNNEILIVDILDYKAGVVFAEQFHSELGNRLHEINPELDFIIIINISKSVSYRTIKDNIHLGNNVAKIYGGGGHAKAAGNEISNEIRRKIIEMLFN